MVCVAGVWLVRKGIMTLDLRRGLSQVVTVLLVPCLLLAKIGGGVDVSVLRQLLVLPGMALVYVGLGWGIGGLLVLMMRPPPEHRRLVLACCGFGNSGYIPYPLVVAIAGTAPLFANDPDAGSRGVVYISLYLVAMSPCLWGIGYPFLSGKPLRSLRWSQLVSPPLLAAVGGLVIGCVPFLRNLLVAPGAPLRVMYHTCDLLGSAAIPCALLVLGANLAERPKVHERTAVSTVLAVAWGRLVLLPLVGCLLTVGLWRMGWLNNDPMLALVLMIQASVPSATNLVLMCQMHGRGEAAISRILVASYLLAVPSMTACVAVFLWVIGRL